MKEKKLDVRVKQAPAPSLSSVFNEKIEFLKGYIALYEEKRKGDKSFTINKHVRESLNQWN
ncbi:hypothetical protein V7O61_06825 [Methanolobus sp. WCC1]|uniref:hypothetical protein n=1 Tax=unclassified Methanolobus TaxID=2629569 RepID=UPI00324F8006